MSGWIQLAISSGFMLLKRKCFYKYLNGTLVKLIYSTGYKPINKSEILKNTVLQHPTYPSQIQHIKRGRAKHKTCKLSLLHFVQTGQIKTFNY